MIDFKRLLDDYMIPNWEDGNNVTRGWVNVQCPLCDDSSNHGGFGPKGGKYHCWRCGGHNPAYVLHVLLGTPMHEASILIDKYSTQELIREKTQKSVERKPKRIVLPGTRPLNLLHRKYLRMRKFDPDYLEEKYDLRGTNHLGPYKHRIIAPVYTNGRIVSYQGRDVTSRSRLRYKACPNDEEVISHKDMLYNIDNCRSGSVLVVEGITDVWRFGDNCAGTFGLTVTPAQVLMLMKFDRVFILFDSEDNALQRAFSLADKLSTSCGVQIVKSDYKDPAQIPQKKAELIKKDLKLT